MSSSFDVGTYPLITLIRISDKYKEWREKVFELQGRFCQSCGTDDRLHVHHTPIPFGKLFIEFKKEYQFLDPELDKQELYDLAMEYDLFWDPYNGEVLCVLCHNLVHPNRTFR